MESPRSPLESSPANYIQPVFELLRGGDPKTICTKYGITRAELDKRLAAYQASRRQAALADQFTGQTVGRNEPCPCGSGKKYKKCCLAKHEEARRSLPAGELQRMEERTKQRQKLEKEVQKGFDLLYSEDYAKAQNFAWHLLESYPEDDRLHDIAVYAAMALRDYEGALHRCRQRWQVAQEERTFYQENGFHKREGADRSQLVHFYSPSTWLEKLWIANRARTYRDRFSKHPDARLAKLAEKLKAANDLKRFPGRQEEGYELRRQALAPLLDELEATGPAAIPYLLPLTYSFSWASLFVPDLLRAYGTDESLQLLAELSMFRLPYFAQKCLANLEVFADRAVPVIEQILNDNPAFDELKVGLLAVLGNIHIPESFAILIRLTEHDNPYLVNWAAEALAKHRNPQAVPYLEKAKERLGALSKIAGAIRDLVGPTAR